MLSAVTERLLRSIPTSRSWMRSFSDWPQLTNRKKSPTRPQNITSKLLRNHPNSEFAEKSREQLGIIGAPVPDPDPARKGAAPPVRPGMVGNLLQQVSGKADVTVDKNGVLISKDGKEGSDLIDQALKYNGQLPTNVTPQAPVQRDSLKQPAPANPAPRSGQWVQQMLCPCEA